MEDPSNQEEYLSRATALTESGIARIHKKYYKPLRIIAVIIAVVFAVLIMFSYAKKPFDRTQSEYSSVVIEEGDDLNAAAARLEDAGIVANASRFVLVSKLTLNTDVKAGTYYLSPSMDAVAVARALCRGNVTLNGFIIPAGFNIDQTFTSLARDGLGDRDAFMNAASDPYLQDIGFIGTDISGADQIEGFLLPGTYNIDAGADEAMIIITMLDNFSNFFNEDYRARADELGLSVRDVITIASMIERETAVDSERARISSVIHNQINLEMTELPSVPLCSPGAESIKAALYPEDGEEIYYVMSSKLDGTHVFTADEAEYNELKAAYEAALDERSERLRQRNADDQQAADEQSGQDAAEEDDTPQTEGGESN